MFFLTLPNVVCNPGVLLGTILHSRTQKRATTHTVWVGSGIPHPGDRLKGFADDPQADLAKAAQCAPYEDRDTDMSLYWSLFVTITDRKEATCQLYHRLQRAGISYYHNLSFLQINSALACNWSNAGLGCVMERLFCPMLLFSWRIKALVFQTWSWAACCGCSCLSKVVGPEGLQTFLPTSAILWLLNRPGIIVLNTTR